MSRRKKVESLDVPALPLNFLLTCSQRHLDEYELKILADLGLPLGSTATASQAAKEKLLEHMPRSKKDALTQIELFEKAALPDSLTTTAKKALLELVSAGMVQRIGKGVSGDPYLYFAGGK